MKIAIIVAMTEKRVIGKENRLPWRIPEDLKRFKKLTMGHTVIMGRKTFESIGKPLPGRANVVISRNPDFQAPGTVIIRSLEEALDRCRNEDEVFVIGGSSLYRAALPLADRLYVTLVHGDFEGDTYFPDFDLEKDFRITERVESHDPEDPSLTYSFITAVREA